MSYRAWLDSEVALIAATSLHSLGALGILAGLALFLMYRGRWMRDAPRTALRKTLTWTTYGSIVANLAGGFMRTYLPEHPTLKDFAVSPWVQVITIKHVFIFAAMAGLLLLVHKVIPAMEQVAPKKRTSSEPALLQQVSVVLVLAGLIAASIMGAQAQITDLGDGFDDNRPQGHDASMDAGGFQTQGTLTGSPLNPASSTGKMQVPSQAVFLDVETTWAGSASQAAFAFTDPTGTVYELQGDDDARFLAVPGEWTYTVEASFAASEAWELSVDFVGIGTGQLLDQAVLVGPDRFYEINTIAEQGIEICWLWSSAADVEFDLHTHFDGQLEYLYQETTHADRGCYTTQREGGHSLLWYNGGSPSVAVDLRVWGDFELASIVG